MEFVFLPHVPGPAALYSRSIDIFPAGNIFTARMV